MQGGFCHLQFSLIGMLGPNYPPLLCVTLDEMTLEGDSTALAKEVDLP